MPAEKVLIVDDEKLVRWSLRQKCEEWGYRVLEADNGSAALRVAHNECPDLVLLDVRLPDADGFNILEKVRNNPKLVKMPVIMMTGMSEVTDIARGLSLGADGYVTKPFKISGLVSAVNTVLGLDQAAT
jgi:two-component system alkaline phosphatase synthesis response regulator PhoP